MFARHVSGKPVICRKLVTTSCQKYPFFFFFFFLGCSLYRQLVKNVQFWMPRSRLKKMSLVKTCRGFSRSQMSVTRLAAVSGCHASTSYSFSGHESRLTNMWSECDMTCRRFVKGQRGTPPPHPEITNRVFTCPGPDPDTIPSGPESEKWLRIITFWRSVSISTAAVMAQESHRPITYIINHTCDATQSITSVHCINHSGQT